MTRSKPFFFFLLTALTVTVFSLFFTLGLHAAGQTPDNTNPGNLVTQQQQLMDFVLNSPNPETTPLYREALEEIYQICTRIRNQKKTMDFYSSLLDSKRFQQLYPYVFYQLSRFYSRPLKDRFLVQALKYASGLEERKYVLERLYWYYKQENLHYLEQSYLAKLMEAQKLSRDFRGLESSHHEMGKIHQRQKDYLAALDSFFTALSYSELLPENRSGHIYLSISHVFQVQNRRELARKYVQKALDASIKSRNKELKILVLNIYSQLAFEDKNYEESLRYADQCLETEAEQGVYICSVPALYRKARIMLKYVESAPPGSTATPIYKQQALALLKTTVEKGLEHEQFENLLPIISEYVERLIQDKKFARAKEYLQKIDEIYAPFYTYYFFYYYLHARLHQEQGDRDGAMTYYRQTADKLEEYFNDQPYRQDRDVRLKTSDIYGHMMKFYLDMYNRTHSRKYIKNALFFSEIKNTYIFDLVTNESSSHSQLSIEKERLKRELERFNNDYQQLLKSNSPRETVQLYEKKLESLRKQNRELQEFILEIPISYSKYRSADLDLSMIQDKLEDGQLIVKFTLLEDHAYVFCIDNDGTSFHRLSVPSADILQMVQRLTHPLDDFTRGKVDYLRVNYDLTLASQLYDILLANLPPLRGKKKPKELFIIPDKDLFKLPFESLVTGFNNSRFSPRVIFSEYASANYLIEKYTVSYFLSLFHFQRESKPSRHKRYILTAFGSPVIHKRMELHDPLAINGNHRELRLFHSLPSSKKEVNTIGRIFGYARIRLFLDDAFNKKQFETFAPQSNIVHIATHFVNNIDYPQYSALLFSPTVGSGPFYHAHEMFNLDLDTDLVVLSACETSEKHLSGFQGLRGMTAAFRHAGTRAMMVSMWPVDEHSWQLTPLFYYHYHKLIAQKPHDRIAPALRAAKLQIMKKSARITNNIEISYSHPFLWANYIVYHFSY